MAKKGTPEGYVVKAVSDYLSYMEKTGKGIWWLCRNMTYNANAGCMIKNHNPINKNGLSDIMGVYRGKFYALEVKAPKGRQSPSQKDFEGNVESHGAVYILVRGIEDIEHIFS